MGRKDPAQGWTRGGCSAGKQKREICYSTFLPLKAKETVVVIIQEKKNYLKSII